ncbi:MAG: hypothetical protein ACLGI7_03490 [Gammaproteobacteria bacterium]
MAPTRRATRRAAQPKRAYLSRDKRRQTLLAVAAGIVEATAGRR